MNEMKEVDYYPEIMKFVSENMESTLCGNDSSLKIVFKNGDGNRITLRSGLLAIVKEQGIPNDHPFVRFAELSPALLLDVFGVVYNDEGFFQVIILEIKLLDSVGLNEYSQLIGYCLCANARYGLLINVNGNVSKPLIDLLGTNENLCEVVREIGHDEKVLHYFGIMRWMHNTKGLNYSPMSFGVKDVSDLCEKIWYDYIYWKQMN